MVVAGKLPASGTSNRALGNIIFPYNFLLTPKCVIAIYEIDIEVGSTIINYLIDQDVICSTTRISVEGSVTDSTKIAVLGLTWAANLLTGVYLGDVQMLDASLPDNKGDDKLIINYQSGITINTGKNPKMALYIRGAAIVKDGNDEFGFHLHTPVGKASNF